MPVKGLNRKSRPADIYAGLGPNAPSGWKPKKFEKFANYLRRLDFADEQDETVFLLRMLIDAGRDEPTQREYLDRLESIREILSQLHNVLYKQYKA
jgi:hypothetical protein